MELLHASKPEASKMSSQKYVDVSEIKNDVVMLKNGSFRAILLASSVNFDLKSPDEQESLIAGYQSFLNSLDFPIQIMIQSRKIDISGYLSTLEKKREDCNQRVDEDANFRIYQLCAQFDQCGSDYDPLFLCDCSLLSNRKHTVKRIFQQGLHTYQSSASHHREFGAV